MEITDNSHPGRGLPKAVSQPALAGTSVAAESPPVTVTAGLGQLPRKKRRLSRSSRRPSRTGDAVEATTTIKEERLSRRKSRDSGRSTLGAAGIPATPGSTVREHTLPASEAAERSPSQARPPEETVDTQTQKTISELRATGPVPTALSAAKPAAAPGPEGGAHGMDVLSIVASFIMLTLAGMVILVLALSLFSARSGSCPPLDKPLSEGTTLVNTKTGRLVGRKVSFVDIPLVRFLGVPFAKSTEGPDRRFSKPVPLSREPCRVHVALEPREPCAQLVNGSVIGSEDCLHANIWVPTKPLPPDGRRRTLVVVLKGSWFETGSSNDRDWSDLAAYGDLVVFAPNHRQGVLGFLHPPGHDDVRDVALDDVGVAIKWVLENADSFEADPNDLVLIGHGSGGYMLSAAIRQMPNNTARRAVYHGLVHGSLLPLDQEDGEPYQSLAKALRCRGPKTLSAWLTCFRMTPMEELVLASRSALPLPLRFAPHTGLQDLLGRSSALVDTVVAGSSLDDLNRLFYHRIMPHAPPYTNKTPDALRNFLVRLITTNPVPSDTIKGLFKARTAEDIAADVLPYPLSVCPTRKVAGTAPQGYHYVSEKGELFDPPFSIAKLAAFALHGAVPELRNGTAWPPFRLSPRTRFVNAKGREKMRDMSATCTKFKM
ncbi:uncharacterized protein LOC144139765 [Haemaphysalis longicornis]